MLVICWGWFWLSWGAAAPGMERVSRVGIFWGPLAEGRALLYLLQPSSRAACSRWLEPVSFPSLCEMQASSEGTSREETSVPSLSQRCLPRGGGAGMGAVGPSRSPPSQLPLLDQAPCCHPTSHPTSQGHRILLPSRQLHACAGDVLRPAGVKSHRDEPSLVGKGRDAPGGQDWGKRGWRTGMGCARRQDSRHYTPWQRLGSG